MRSPRALACPDSLKGVLSARDAARALARGFAAAGVVADELPLADGGEGTLDALERPGSRETRHPVVDAFGRPRLARVLHLAGGTAVVEAAEVIPLDPSRRDVHAASSRGLGELIAGLDGVASLVVALGGTATMDAGRGLLEALDRLPAPTRALYDVRTRLYDAPRLFGPQKGATADDVSSLDRAFRARRELAPFAELPGSGAAGGLGAALASLGAELVPGAPTVLELVGFDPSPYALVVTGEGTVDETTREGKAPGVVAERCGAAGVRCVVFGGRVLVPGAEALSGVPERAAADLEELGERLGRSLRV
jgi:glycerate kinase